MTIWEKVFAVAGIDNAMTVERRCPKCGRWEWKCVCDKKEELEEEEDAE